MAYTPTEWVTGDVITATKLNNMEQGIEDAFVAPAVTIADAGDVLTVNSSGVWAAAAPASQLPEVTAADQGKILTVDSSGDWAAAANIKNVYVAKAGLTLEQGATPVITQGNFADAYAVIAAGGIVTLLLTVEHLGNSQFFSCEYFSGENAAIHLFSVSTSAGNSLVMNGYEWTESGLVAWPTA